MSIRKAAGGDPWGDAVGRATAATAVEQPGGMDEDCWELVAGRDITAMVLYALHLRDGLPVADVPWRSVLWWLWDDQRVSALVEEVLPTAGHDLARVAEPADPVVERWRWLTRTWNPDAPIRPRARQEVRAPLDELLYLSYSRQDDAAPEPRWGGMSRGLAAGLPDPALEVCVGWAAAAVQAAITTEHGGYARFDRVRVTGGPFKGHRGYVRQSGWSLDDASQTAGGPLGYVVDLDDTEGTEDIDAELLKRSSDQRWPRRRAGTLKDGPPPGLHDPLPPVPSCADDLAKILDRAVNPEIVPPGLRASIVSAKHHHHVLMDCQASPAPARFTWRVIDHWYQLTEHYADDQRVAIWEVEVSRHLHDPAPVSYLALDEDGARAAIDRAVRTR
ncbi:hypothetical protein AB0F71_02490 [Kitasatospora sp. NPDC028055]|uniref:hypothetical protein n=1 Tax=Kitasatospora sp. NPDC028055 TaxID=3155653 RepID=UPI0033DCF3A3